MLLNALVMLLLLGLNKGKLFLRPLRSLLLIISEIFVCSSLLEFSNVRHVSERFAKSVQAKLIAKATLFSRKVETSHTLF